MPAPKRTPGRQFVAVAESDPGLTPPTSVTVTTGTPGIDFLAGQVPSAATVPPQVEQHRSRLQPAENSLLGAALQHALRPEHGGRVEFRVRHDPQIRPAHMGLEIIDAAETVGITETTDPAGIQPVPLHVVFIVP